MNLKIDWKPYPKYKPIKNWEYLTTIQYYERRMVVISKCINGKFYIESTNTSIVLDGDVIAWADLPEAYNDESK